jgi:TctA family transporter
MLDSAMAALASLADPSLLIMLLIGTVAGLIMGLIPGLGGTGAVAILLPITFCWAPRALRQPASPCSTDTPWQRKDKRRGH